MDSLPEPVAEDSELVDSKLAQEQKSSGLLSKVLWAISVSISGLVVWTAYARYVLEWSWSILILEFGTFLAVMVAAAAVDVEREEDEIVPFWCLIGFAAISLTYGIYVAVDIENTGLKIGAIVLGFIIASFFACLVYMLRKGTRVYNERTAAMTLAVVVVGGAIIRGIRGAGEEGYSSSVLFALYSAFFGGSVIVYFIVRRFWAIEEDVYNEDEEDLAAEDSRHVGALWSIIEEERASQKSH